MKKIIRFFLVMVVALVCLPSAMEGQTTGGNPTPPSNPKPKKTVRLEKDQRVSTSSPLSVPDSFVVLIYEEDTLSVGSVYGTTLNPSNLHLSIYTQRNNDRAVYQGELNTMDDQLPLYLEAGTYTLHAQASLTEVYSGTLVVE